MVCRIRRRQYVLDVTSGLGLELDKITSDPARAQIFTPCEQAWKAVE